MSLLPPKSPTIETAGWAARNFQKRRCIQNSNQMQFKHLVQRNLEAVSLHILPIKRKMTSLPSSSQRKWVKVKWDQGLSNALKTFSWPFRLTSLLLLLWWALQHIQERFYSNTWGQQVVSSDRNKEGTVWHCLIHGLSRIPHTHSPGASFCWPLSTLCQYYSKVPATSVTDAKTWQQVSAQWQLPLIFLKASYYSS